MRDHLQIAIARHAYVIAVGQVIRLGPDTIVPLAVAARDTPSSTTIRRLIDASRHEPWYCSLVEAVAEIGVVAAEDVL